MSDNRHSFDHSPLADAPPAVRATYTAEQRLELANYCGPDTARTVPMDTGHDHAPIAERVTLPAVPQLGFVELRGWLVGSQPDMTGTPGALSLVHLPGRGAPLVVGTHETRLGWGSDYREQLGAGYDPAAGSRILEQRCER